MMHPVLKRALQFYFVLKAACVALFFLSFIPASQSFASDSDQLCKGIDLIEKMTIEEPEKLAKIRAQAAAIINGRSIFWKIEKGEMEPSWLLGTMHMTDPAVTQLPAAAEKALNQSKTVVIESTETLDPAKAAAAMVQLQHLTFLGAGQSLQQILPVSLMAKLETQLTPRGIPIQIASRMQPWVVATMLAIPVCEMQAKRSGLQILDHRIAQHALDENKTLVGLESTEEQFSAIAGLPQTFHVNALKETLSMGSDQVENMIATMKRLYSKGHTAMIMPLMKTLSPRSFDGPGTAEFQEALISKRNRLMAQRAEAAIESGGAFVAVGALHLPGQTGLVKLLRDRGYTVTAVQ